MPSATRWAYLAEMLFLFFVFVAASTLVRARPFHLLAQTARLLESPTGAFIALQSQGRSKHIFTRKAPAGKCVFNIRCHCPLRPRFVKKSFQKIRRFSGSSNIKNKISAEDAQSETEGIQIVRLPERGRTSDNSFPARPTGSGDPEPAASLRSAAAGGAHPLPLHAAS